MGKRKKCYRCRLVSQGGSDFFLSTRIFGELTGRVSLSFSQFPELFVAAYNRNPMAIKEPDGIVAVWNLHLLERPEFVFHAQVSSRPSYLTLSAVLMFDHPLVVGRTISMLLTVSPKPDHRRNLLWSNPPLGHSISFSKSYPQNSSLRFWSHPSRLLSTNGRYSERSLTHFRLYRRNRLRLDSRHVGTTTRIPRVDSSSTHEN